MELQEFKTKYTRYSKPFKITGSWGVYDAYKYLRKNGWPRLPRPLKEHEFYMIIRSVNKLLANELSNGGSVSFPFAMGNLELRKYEKGASLVDGKLKVTYPIDWAKTWELWYNDRGAMKDKLLIRDEQKWVYHVRYCKYPANYKNKCFYQFALNRGIKNALRDNIKKGKVDTLW